MVYRLLCVATSAVNADSVFCQFCDVAGSAQALQLFHADMRYRRASGFQRGTE